MVLEGRTVCDLADLRDYVKAALAVIPADVDPATVKLHKPLDLRLMAVQKRGGWNYDIEASK